MHALALALMLVATAFPTERRSHAEPPALVALRNDPALRGLNLGVEARCIGPAANPSKGALKAAHQADQLLAPASGAKLLSTAAALTRLGVDTRWTTTVHGDLHAADGVVDGDLVIVPGGDPDLQADDLAQLARTLQTAGVREVRGRIVVDLSRFPGSAEPPAYDLKVSDASYHPHVPAFAVGYGAVNVTVRPGKAVGQKVRVGATLSVPSITFDADATTVAGKDTATLTLEVRESQGKTVLVVGGTIGLKAPAQVFKKRVADPARVATEVFAQALKKVGIRIREATPRVVTDGSVKRPPELARLDSKPLAELVRETNTTSNNFMAELIFRHLGEDAGAAAWTRAQEVATKTLGDYGLGPSEVHIANGSGLYPATRVTAHGMVTLLVALSQPGPVADAFRDSLARAGESGTLKARLASLKGHLRAKTGTLDDAISLSGYLDAASCKLAFSVLVNGPMGEGAVSPGSPGAKKDPKKLARGPSVAAAIDRFVGALSKL